MPAPQPYEVHAIRYATVERRSHENFIGGDLHDTPSRLDYFVWVVRNRERTVLVDTGFTPAMAAKRRREYLRTPRQGLEALGVAVEDIRDVVVTHMHYDHAGTFDIVPGARLHLQEREMAYATGRHMAHATFSGAYEVDDVVGLVRQVYAGNVCFLDGDEQIAPGLSLHRVGGHTAGLQVVRVYTRVGWIVLASDATHLYANMQQVRPFPIVYRVDEMVDGYERCRRLADDPAFVVPGHDPLVLGRYAPSSPQLAGIAVRLDAEPRP